MMNYFRAIIDKNEISLRAFELTSLIVNQICTNYNAWYVRRLCLEQIAELDLEQELIFVNELTLKNVKSFQIWYSPLVQTNF